jgi:alkanesulfonate monooxygenase SsuD/methylene tetrahydromethanopterin reductase-like flavin-dependent oxidoreductase (luciferase family)
MQYALTLGAAGACGDPRSAAELARLAEQSGWDALLLEDYVVHWRAPETYDPWMVLTAMALATERLRVGTLVTPLPRRRPWQVARQAATLDRLSGGRVILGAGSGDLQSVDFAGFGEALGARQRAEQLDEGLAIIAGLWQGQPFSFSGKHYRVQEVTLVPPPVQQPRIPIWIGGQLTRRGPRERAARWDGASLYRAEPPEWVDLTPDDVRGILERGSAGRPAGWPPYEVCVGGRRRGPVPAAPPPF